MYDTQQLAEVVMKTPNRYYLNPIQGIWRFATTEILLTPDA